MDVDNQDKKDGRCLIVKSRTNKVVVIEQLSQDKSIPKLKNIESVHHEEASHNTRHNKLDWQAL